MYLHGRTVEVQCAALLFFSRQGSADRRLSRPAQLSAAHVVNWSMFVNRINYPIATCCITGFIMRIADKILPAPLIMWAWEGLRRI